MYQNLQIYNGLDGVMGSMFASIAVDRVFDPRSGQPNNYTNDTCCFSSKLTAWRSKTSE